AAGEQRVDDHPGADCEAARRHTGGGARRAPACGKPTHNPHLLHHPTELVPHHQRRHTQRVVAEVARQLRTADADGLDLHADVVGRQLGSRGLPPGHLPRTQPDKAVAHRTPQARTTRRASWSSSSWTPRPGASGTVATPSLIRTGFFTRLVL